MTIDCFNALEELVQFELPNYGKLTPQLRWVLMNSHCHSFALAIHSLTRWPMVGKIAGGEIEHVFCQMPDGKLADAEGAAKWPEELFGLNSDPGYRLLPPNFEFLAKDGWLKSVEGVLIPFAQTRIEEVKQENGVTVTLRHTPSCASGNSFLPALTFAQRDALSRGLLSLAALDSSGIRSQTQDKR